MSDDEKLSNAEVEENAEEEAEVIGEETPEEALKTLLT